MVSPVRGDHRRFQAETPLIALFKFAEPALTALDPTFGQFQWVGEIERRYSIWGQPGKLAITGFLTRGRMGSFEDAIQLAALTGGPANIIAVRQYQSRSGISMNLEQQLVPNVGFFARAGIADGNKEPYEFTDVDRTVAAGFSVSGKQWGRDDDTWGIAGVVNGISNVHQAFLNAGGLGILVGDGMLPHPGNEGILETYYSFPVFASKITLDYQLIVNPAYKCDVPSARCPKIRQCPNLDLLLILLVSEWNGKCAENDF